MSNADLNSFLLASLFTESTQKLPFWDNDLKQNKPGTAKVGAISKAQNCKKGDPLGFLNLQLVEKYEKKLKEDIWEILIF